MKKMALVLVSVAVLGVVLGVVFDSTGSRLVQAQEGASASARGGEHGKLAMFVGDWEAHFSLMGMEVKGEATSRLIEGGLWLVSEFTGNFGGRIFEGHSYMGYSLKKKKFISTMINSMSPELEVFEGSFDETGKMFSYQGETVGMMGQKVLEKSVETFESPDRRTAQITHVDAQGNEMPFMKITYVRKK